MYKVKINKKMIVIFLCISVFCTSFYVVFNKLDASSFLPASGDYIKWVEFNVSYEAMKAALKCDVDSYDQPVRISFVETLAYLGAKYSGDFKKYKPQDMYTLVNRLKNGEKMEDITADSKYYNYYREAYGAVLDAFVGEYQIKKQNEDGTFEWQTKYGLKVFSPIANGYDFGHYDDFGNKRSYGYTRKHLGNDLMGSIGTPIVAVESGVVEAVGWNRYGGWRIGIRSFDGRRYYYYAHLRKDHPYHADIEEGKVVKAGDVIGYLGMTGYSTKENVNNINVPHLHFGVQLIFDESQKEGNNEIWIDLYDMVEFLRSNRADVVKDTNSKEYHRKYDFFEQSISDYEN